MSLFRLKDLSFLSNAQILVRYLIIFSKQTTLKGVHYMQSGFLTRTPHKKKNSNKDKENLYILDRIFALVIGYCFGTYIVYIAYLPPHPLQ